MKQQGELAKIIMEKNMLIIEKRSLEEELRETRKRIEELQREKATQEKEMKKIKEFKFFDTPCSNDPKSNFISALQNLRISYHNIIEYVNVAGMEVTDLLSHYDELVTTRLPNLIGVQDVISMMFTIGNLFKTLTDWILQNIPRGIMNLRESTRTTAFTLFKQREKFDLLKFLESEKKGDGEWRTRLENMRLTPECKEEIIELVPKMLQKSKEIPLSRRLEWQKKFRHDNLSLDKKRKRYVFSKTVNKKKHILRINFELVPDFSSHKILCKKWDDYMKENQHDERTCWDDHNILKNKNEKLFGLV